MESDGAFFDACNFRKILYGFAFDIVIKDGAFAFGQIVDAGEKLFIVIRVDFL